jgi:hypothetical protein
LNYIFLSTKKQEKKEINLKLYWLKFHFFFSETTYEMDLLLIRNVHLFSFMVFNATFKNILVISWWLVLLMEETGLPTENHRPNIYI